MSFSLDSIDCTERCIHFTRCLLTMGVQMRCDGHSVTPWKGVWKLTLAELSGSLTSYEYRQLSGIIRTNCRIVFWPFGVFVWRTQCFTEAYAEDTFSCELVSTVRKCWQQSSFLQMPAVIVANGTDDVEGAARKAGPISLFVCSVFTASHDEPVSIISARRNLTKL